MKKHVKYVLKKHKEAKAKYQGELNEYEKSKEFTTQDYRLA